MFRFVAQFRKPQFRADVAKGAGPVLFRLLEKVREEMRRRFTSPKSGRPGPFARRSAKGEAPARQTGRLYNAIPIVQVSDLKAELTVNAPYASFLEDRLNRPFALVSVESTVEMYRLNSLF